MWAALLTVTLGSLAAGYYLGGAWADRRPTTRLLGMSLAIGALALALSVVIAPALIAAVHDLGQRSAPLLCATLLFGPSLVFLGMTGPITIRLLIADVRLAGHGVDRIYAISTVGSLVSTLLVSFVFIPAFETHVILLATAVVLALNAALGLRGRERGAALLMVGVCALRLTINHRDRDTIDLRDQAHSGRRSRARCRSCRHAPPHQPAETDEDAAQCALL